MGTHVSKPDHDRLVEVEATYLNETDYAALFAINDKETWIPKTVLHNLETFDQGDKGDLQIEEWFAMEKGLL